MGTSKIMFKLFLVFAIIVEITQCFPRDSRSVTPVEISFFPGLTEGSKDALVFEQWRQFLEEEEAELAREESVALKLIQQGKPSLVEPIEYATQKRLLHQFKGSKKHRHDIQDNAQGINNGIEPVGGRQHLEYSNDIQEPLEIVLIGPEKIQNTAYSFGRVPFPRKPESGIKPTINPLSSLQLPSIPNETVNRLLGDAPGSSTHSTSISDHTTKVFPEADQVDRTNVTSITPPSSDHEEEKNKRIQEIIKNQQQILEKDLNFLLEDERSSTDSPTVVTHTASNNPSISDVDSVSTMQETSTRVNTQKWTKEEQIDWEENHEFDA